jgi:hypothetical protein
MNQPESNLTSRPMDSSEICEDLRRQITILFGALVVTSFTVTAFLGLEARRASAELLAIKPNADQAEKVLAQDNATVQSVYARLEEFGRTHPDFQSKVLVKYKINSNGAKAAPKK